MKPAVIDPPTIAVRDQGTEAARSPEIVPPMIRDMRPPWAVRRRSCRRHRVTVRELRRPASASPR